MNYKLIHKRSLLFLLIAYSLSFTVTKAQTRTLDSLRRLLKTEKDDTNKAYTLCTLALALYNVNPDTTILFAQQALSLSEKLSCEKGEGRAYMAGGVGYWVEGNYTKALDYELKSLKICEKLGDKRDEMKSLCDIGLVYVYQANYARALDYDLKALKIAEEVGDKQGQASNLGNIGTVYYDQGDYPDALDYYLKSLRLCETIGDKQRQANSLGNIGNLYYDQGDYSKALDYYSRTLKMDEELGNKQGQAINLGNTGTIYMAQHDYSKALDYFMKALKINEEFDYKQEQADNLGNIGNAWYNQGNYSTALSYDMKALRICEELEDKQGQADNLGNIGRIYTKTGKYKEAEEFLKKAIALDSTIGVKNDLSDAEIAISNLYDTLGRYKLALYWFKKASVLKDTLFNINKNKAMTRKELTYQFDKKQAEEKAEQDKKDAVAEQDRRKQLMLRNFFMAGFILVLALAFFIFRGYRQKQEANKIITTQKEEVEEQKAELEKQKILVEEKNKDILDSITYAKRLQDAILPPISVIKQYLPDSFILYKPKDIVAGDFYWMERAGDHILIAACDCTGHGVPGALVSVVCSNALNRAHNEFKIRNTGKVLDKVRDLVLETFEKSEGGDVKDGMDISFCAINTKTGDVEWSGAYNPLWYTSNGELKEITGDKQPIGKVDNPKAFSTHTLQLKKGDAIYLFTDGYADQFGGPQGKKFKYKQLQQLLIDNVKLTMEEQGRVLNNTLEAWKGSLEQVDDILVMGIKV
jgi:tetratricopeptide (TPR) repeat protein